MLVTEKLKRDIKFFHLRMRLEQSLNVEKSEPLIGEIKDRLLKSRERLEEAMSQIWSEQQILEREKAIIQMLQKGAEKSCLIDEKLPEEHNHGGAKNKKGTGSKKMVQGRLERRQNWQALRPKKRRKTGNSVLSSK